MHPRTEGAFPWGRGCCTWPEVKKKVIGYLNESSDPYLDNYQSGSHVSFVHVNTLHTYGERPCTPLHFFMFFFYLFIFNDTIDRFHCHAKTKIN